MKNLGKDVALSQAGKPEFSVSPREKDRTGERGDDHSASVLSVQRTPTAGINCFGIAQVLRQVIRLTAGPVLSTERTFRHDQSGDDVLVLKQS